MATSLIHVQVPASFKPSMCVRLGRDPASLQSQYLYILENGSAGEDSRDEDVKPRLCPARHSNRHLAQVLNRSRRPRRCECPESHTCNSRRLPGCQSHHPGTLPTRLHQSPAVHWLHSPGCWACLAGSHHGWIVSSGHGSAGEGRQEDAYTAVTWQALWGSSNRGFVITSRYFDR